MLLTMKSMSQNHSKVYCGQNTVDEIFFCKNVQALTEMQGIFFLHSYLTKLTVALAHSFFEHNRDGEPVFLVLLNFRAVISGVGFVSCAVKVIYPLAL